MPAPDLQCLLDAIPDLLAMVDVSGTVVASNAALSQRVQSTQSDTIPVALGLDLGVWRRSLHSALAGNVSEYTADVLTSDGRHAVLACTMTPLVSSDDSATGIQVQCVAVRISDVTNEQQRGYQTEQYAARLKELVERYEAISHATHDAVWDWVVDDNTLAWSRGIFTNFGHDVRVTSLSWWEDNIHPDDVEDVVTSLTVWSESNDETWSSEYRFRCSDGTYRWVYDRGLMLHDQGRRRLIGAMIDVSELRGAMARISRQNELLREIASMSSHQLRGPLTSLMGLLYLYDKEHPSNPVNGQVIDYLDVAARNLDKIIHQVIQHTSRAAAVDDTERLPAQER